MSLKQLAKERLLWAVKQVVVPFGRVIMLVDPKSLKVVSSCCSVSELMDEGVDLVEILTKKREPLKGKNVLCILSDDFNYLDLLLKDFIPGKENYLGVFIMFNCHLRDDSVLKKIATNIDFDKILGCFELHLNFVTFESNVFFTQNYRLKELYSLDRMVKSSLSSPRDGLNSARNTVSSTFANINPNNNNSNRSSDGSSSRGLEYIDMVASRLASVCSVLNVMPKVSYYRNNCLLSKKVADSVVRLMSQTLGQGNSRNAELIIFDRSVDFSPLFIHEYTYQAFVYDLVKINYCSYPKHEHEGLIKEVMKEAIGNVNKFLHKNKGSQELERNGSIRENFKDDKMDNCYEFKYVTNANKTENRVALLDSELDVIWKKYRHLHIQKVNTQVLDEINKFSATNSPNNSNKNNSKTNVDNKTTVNNKKVMNSLQMLRNLPSLQYLLEKYWAHVTLTEKCFDLVKAKNLIKIGSVEQMIATNMDATGKHMSHSKCVSNLVDLLSEDIEEFDKVRLILLYFTNYNNLNNSHLTKLSKEVKLSHHAGNLLQKVISHLPIMSTTGNVSGLNYFSNSNNSGNMGNDDGRYNQYNNYQTLNFTGGTDKSKSKSKDDDKLVHRLEKNDLYSYYKKLNPEYDLSRFLSEMTFILYQYLNNNYSHPLVQNSDGTNDYVKEDKKNKKIKDNNLNTFNLLFSGNKEDKDVKKKIIIYVLGGITFSECREIYKLSENKNIDIYLGGDEILIPSKLLEEFE